MVRVLLAEDMDLIRGAIAALLAQEPDLEVVAEVATGDRVVPEVLAHRPDVAVLDIQMPGADGLDAAAEIVRRLPQCRILMLTGVGRPALLRKALDLGVGGFLQKEAQRGELPDAIRRVAAGERVVDPRLAAEALTARPSPLTPQETQVLRLAAEGSEPAEIASRLHLARGTVRNYLGAAVTKLDARNRLDAVRIAAEAEWI